jgi:hypothetical protein
VADIDMKKLLISLEEKNVPVAEFAKIVALDGIRFASKTRLNEAFRDVNPIPLRDDVAEQVWDLWQEILLMSYESLPYPMDLTNGERTHASLQIFRGLQALKGNEDGQQQ